VKVAGSNPATPTNKAEILRFWLLLFIKMFTVYILFSKQLQKYYVGYSSKSAQDRLKERLNTDKTYQLKTNKGKFTRVF